MNTYAYAIIGLTAIVAVLVGFLTFAVFRLASGLRDARRNLRSGGSESAFLTATLQEALGKLKAQEQAMSARAVMVRHPWTRRVLEERGTGGPAQIALIERNLAILFAAGFSVELAHHALHVLDSRIFGFSPALFDETGRPQPSAEEQAALVQALAPYPSVARLAGAVSHDGPLGACDDDIEFAFGLDLILDGLERVGTS